MRALIRFGRYHFGSSVAYLGRAPAYSGRVTLLQRPCRFLRRLSCGIRGQTRIRFMLAAFVKYRAISSIAQSCPWIPLPTGQDCGTRLQCLLGGLKLLGHPPGFVACPHWLGGCGRPALPHHRGDGLACYHCDGCLAVVRCSSVTCNCVGSPVDAIKGSTPLRSRTVACGCSSGGGGASSCIVMARPLLASKLHFKETLGAKTYSARRPEI